MQRVDVPRLSRSDLTRASDALGEGGPELDGLICPSDRCGRVFSEPLRLTDLSHRPREETYYACPHCFSRLNIDGIMGDSKTSGEKSHGGTTPSALDSKGKKSDKLREEKTVSAFECPHQLGYLGSRSKGSEIPDDCLTCPKILQCMTST